MHPTPPPTPAGGGQEIFLSLGFYLSSLDSFFCTDLRQWGKPKDQEDIRGYIATHSRWRTVESFMGLAEPLLEVGSGAKGLQVRRVEPAGLRVEGMGQEPAVGCLVP